MSTSNIREIEEVAHHRNGVGGYPFYVVAFTAEDDNGQVAPFVATVFDHDEEMESRNAGVFRNPKVAVLRRDLLNDGVVTFGINSYRGDRYATALYDAITAWEDGGRDGLFPPSTHEERVS